MKLINKNCFISIIIPVYNSEKTLKRCLDSVLAQTYSNYEIIIINDGSNDGSEIILQEYIELSHVRYICQENAGVSAARNNGIRNSLGEYLCFVDSDDYIEENYLETFVDNIRAFDLVYQIPVFEGKRHENVTLIATSTTNERLIDIFYRMYKEYTLGYIWAVCFKKSILQKNDIWFDKDVYFQEDLLFMSRYVQHCTTMCCVPSYQYHYIEPPLNKTYRSSDNAILLYHEFSKLFRNEYGYMDTLYDRTITAFIHRVLYLYRKNYYEEGSLYLKFYYDNFRYKRQFIHGNRAKLFYWAARVCSFQMMNRLIKYLSLK